MPPQSVWPQTTMWRHVEVDHGVLDRGSRCTGAGGGGRHHVGDVANIEELAGIGAGDQLRHHPRVRASDPKNLGVLAFFGEFLENFVFGFEFLPELSMP